MRNKVPTTKEELSTVADDPAFTVEAQCIICHQDKQCGHTCSWWVKEGPSWPTLRTEKEHDVLRQRYVCTDCAQSLPAAA